MERGRKDRGEEGNNGGVKEGREREKERKEGERKTPKVCRNVMVVTMET